MVSFRSARPRRFRRKTFARRSHFRGRRRSFARRSSFRRGRFSRRFKRFGRRTRSYGRRYRRKGVRFGRRFKRTLRRSRRFTQKGRSSGGLPFTLRTISTEHLISTIGQQTWYDIPALGDPIFMMQDLLADALANLVKIMAARNPISRIQGVGYPWNLDTSTKSHQGAVMQAADINPKHFYVTFKEIIKYHMYNTSNITSYVTIIKKIPKKTSKLYGYGCWQQRLDIFPATAKDHPLSITTAGMANNVMIKDGSLTWGYPDLQSISNPALDGGSINPFVPTAGANLGCLIIPRQYGAFCQFFPTDPWPSFVQQNSGNFFNQGAAQAQVNLNGAGNFINQDPTSSQYDNEYNFITALNTKTAGGGLDPAFYLPSVATNYFTGNTNPTAATGNAGDQGQRGQAYYSVNTTGNPTFTSPATFDQHPPAQRTMLSGATVYTASSVSGYTNQADPFSSALGGGGTDWSTHPYYDEMKNRCMRLLFKMHKRRITLPPGKVLRWSLRGRRATINPARDSLILHASSAVNPSVWTGSANATKTLDGWGTSASPNNNVPTGTGGQLEAPSLWGPEWPCRTILWSCALRGQTAKHTGASDLAQIMPAEVLLKKDHIIKYNVKYRPVTSLLKKHATIRNLLEYNPSSSNYAVQYPIAGVIAGGASATANSSANPVAV